MEFLFIGLIGYLIGSVPFAYVIGKIFYGTDVRQHGSGNLGGSNTGRVLGATVFFVPLAVFLTVLAVTKIVSLSSTISACTAAVYLWLMGAGTAVVSTAAICAGLIVLRHSGNIRRMIGGTERKISWMG